MLRTFKVRNQTAVRQKKKLVRFDVIELTEPSSKDYIQSTKSCIIGDVIKGLLELDVTKVIVCFNDLAINKIFNWNLHHLCS